MNINIQNCKKTYHAFRVLLNSGCLRILTLLNDAEMDVTGIYTKLEMEQAVCSQFLAKLRKAGLVKNRRDGKRIFYSIDLGMVEKLNSAAALFNK